MRPKATTNVLMSSEPTHCPCSRAKPHAAARAARRASGSTSGRACPCRRPGSAGAGRARRPCASSPRASRSRGAPSLPRQGRTGGGFGVRGGHGRSDLTPRHGPRRILCPSRATANPFASHLADRRGVPEEPVRVVQVDEEDRRACGGSRARTRAMVSGTSGCGISAIERPGISSAEKNVPSTNAVSVGVGEKVLEPAVPLLPLVDVGQPEQSCAPGRARGRPRCRSPRRDAGRGSRWRGGRGVSANSAPGSISRIAMFSRATRRLQGRFSRRNARHRRRAVDGDLPRAEDLAAELREAQVVADVRVREQDRRPAGRRALPSARRSRASRRSGSACRRPGRRGRARRRDGVWPGSRRASTQSVCWQPACGTPPSCAMPRTIASGPASGRESRRGRRAGPSTTAYCRLSARRNHGPQESFPLHRPGPRPDRRSAGHEGRPADRHREPAPRRQVRHRPLLRRSEGEPGEGVREEPPRARRPEGPARRPRLGPLRRGPQAGRRAARDADREGLVARRGLDRGACARAGAGSGWCTRSGSSR